MCTLIQDMGFMMFLFVLFFNCLVRCFSIIVGTPAVLRVLYACFVFLYLPLFSTTEHVSHGKVL